MSEAACYCMSRMTFAINALIDELHAELTKVIVVCLSEADRLHDRWRCVLVIY